MSQRSGVPGVTAKLTKRGHGIVYVGASTLTINQAFDLSEKIHEAALEAQRLMRQEP